MKKLIRAKTELIINEPFYASLLMPMPLTENENIETIVTDGDTIEYNPKFLESLTQDETLFVLAHEVLHCVFDHMGERKNRTPNKWNQAADYLVNGILIKDKIGTMPSGGLHDPSLVIRGGNTTIGIYNLLPDSAEKNECGKPGGSMDKVSDSGSKQGKVKPDDATLSQKSAEMKVRVLQARNIAKMQGKLSDGLNRAIGEALKPRIDWKNELRRFLSDRAKTEYTFARPKRRFLAEDIYLPSLGGEKMGSVTVAVDCSGSVNAELLSSFSSEINAIRQDVSPSKIDVIYFDSKVCRVESFESDQEIALKPTGGGGTNFSPVFDHINKQDTLPVACIFLTDLVCYDFGLPPSYPVLWAVLENNYDRKAPFGEVLKVSL